MDTLQKQKERLSVKEQNNVYQQQEQVVKFQEDPKVLKTKKRVLDPYKDEIKKYLEMSLSQTNILKIINSQLKKTISLTAFRYFIENDKVLSKI